MHLWYIQTGGEPFQITGIISRYFHMGIKQIHANNRVLVRVFIHPRDISYLNVFFNFKDRFLLSDHFVKQYCHVVKCSFRLDWRLTSLLLRGHRSSAPDRDLMAQVAVYSRLHVAHPLPASKTYLQLSSLINRILWVSNFLDVVSVGFGVDQN